ncbi:hypothetical protein ACFL2V_19610 [Pseudomonadota bacterium]
MLKKPKTILVVVLVTFIILVAASAIFYFKLQIDPPPLPVLTETPPSIEGYHQMEIEEQTYQDGTIQYTINSTVSEPLYVSNNLLMTTVYINKDPNRTPIQIVIGNMDGNAKFGVEKDGLINFNPTNVNDILQNHSNTTNLSFRLSFNPNLVNTDSAYEFGLSQNHQAIKFAQAIVSGNFPPHENYVLVPSLFSLKP